MREPIREVIDRNLENAMEMLENGSNSMEVRSVQLELRVTDPEVIAELSRYSQGAQRERFALAALRIGVLALRTAGGQLDAAAIREAGSRLVADVQRELGEHAANLLGDLRSTLKGYFDLDTGLLPQRIEALVKKDGDLERLLRSHLGPEDSVLARTLAERIGENSPLFRVLSPTEKNGLLCQVAGAIKSELEEQRGAILTEFSLDNENSALSRLTARVLGSNEEFAEHLGRQISSVVGEFSLDRGDSALSRLVAKVEAAQKTISAEFSTDNEQSAISRLSRLLADTSVKIDSSLTLDSENSALSRLKRELARMIEGLVSKNTDFQTEIRETLAALSTRKQESARSTLHGTTFEEQLGAVLADQSQRVGDMLEDTRSKTGVIANCKKGDFVIHLGPESAAPGVPIAWEAKEDRSYKLKDAIDEMEIARKNRQAQFGAFVFSKRTAPTGLPPFARYGTTLIVVWDAEDPSTDINLTAAYSVARGLMVRLKNQSENSKETVGEIERATRAIEKQLKFLDDFKRYGDTMRRDGEKLSDRADRMKADLLLEIGRIDEQIETLKTTTEGAAD